jgi:beta-lactamase class A
LSPTSEPTGQPTAGAAATTADPHADPFSAAVTGYLTGRAGTVSAAIYDVNTGQTWTLGTGTPQATGSLVKVDILQALLARRPSGLAAADQARARSMIENNNNAPATTLWNQAGRAAGLGAYNASVGLQRTTPSTCLVCAGFGWPGWGLTTTTPADQLLLLRALINGPLLSPAGRGYALSLMENVEPDQRWGVSAGVPPGVRVALKSAWVPLTLADTDWQINSEGWISGDGRDYLVAILTTGNPDEQYGIATINTVSAMLWPAMG